MALLRGKTEGIQLISKPHRIRREEQIVWICFLFEIKWGTTDYLSYTSYLTQYDLIELRSFLRDISACRRDAFLFSNTDNDFILEAQCSESKNDIFVGCWVGEPYQLMKGYRFVVVVGDLGSFADELEADEALIMRLNEL